jgi:hypothetical protein
LELFGCEGREEGGFGKWFMLGNIFYENIEILIGAFFWFKRKELMK